jgi:flagellar motor switch protein FliN/FliY
MNPQPFRSVSHLASEYGRIWAESIRRVLEQLSGSSRLVEEFAEEHCHELARNAEESKVWTRFGLGGALRGEHAFVTPKSHALHLAQELMSEPFEPTAEFTATHRDALTELLRQVAGLAASELKSSFGGEVEISFLGSEPPEWELVQAVGYRLSGPSFAEVRLVAFLSSEAYAALVATEPATPPPPVAAEDLSAEPVASPEMHASNLDLLLDITVDATICFGQRQVLLREILELRPGAVVELDRQIDEPAELLVAGRIIARGEVVVVEGNYGLRITEILNPLRRIESLPQ